MPQSYYNAPETLEPSGLGLTQISNACPNPMTPPAEHHSHYEPVRIDANQLYRLSALTSDNTAAGMAQSQEDSIYLTPATTPEAIQDVFNSEDKEKIDITLEDYRDGTKTPVVVNAYEASDDIDRCTSSPSSPRNSTHFTSFSNSTHSIQQSIYCINNEEDKENQEMVDSCRSLDYWDYNMTSVADTARHQGLAPIDLKFDRSTTTKPWTFSRRRLIPEYPSHVFQSFSRYTGTQQSDRQIYNVDVTILTVDMAQCTMTGYLLIRGLTPEHDTLQTYFTGEIIGSPPKLSDEKQYHTFRTHNKAWGATEKTDMTHWARFPAWRTLATHAKRDLDFTYPVDGSNWWEQENVFMRWKEHFLVPDHKTKSIAGASFEGFYYICLNQVQGKISGIYYHSKSEKYQQLELKHEGHPEMFNRGITPCVEFR